MTVLTGGWVTAGANPDGGLQVRNSAIAGRVIIKDAGLDGRLSYMRECRWRDWLMLVVSREYKPGIDCQTGELLLDVADSMLFGSRMRAIRTSRDAWEEFVEGARDGVFDKLPPYTPVEGL